MNLQGRARRPRRWSCGEQFLDPFYWCKRAGEAINKRLQDENASVFLAGARQGSKRPASGMRLERNARAWIPLKRRPPQLEATYKPLSPTSTPHELEAQTSLFKVEPAVFNADLGHIRMLRSSHFIRKILYLDRYERRSCSVAARFVELLRKPDQERRSRSKAG
jgi:hypothetical protein